MENIELFNNDYEGINKQNVIDFDNPDSITNYGGEILEEFSRLREQLPLVFDDKPYLSYKFTEPMAKIEEFNNSLSGEEEDKKGMLRQSKLANGFCMMLNRISGGNIDLLHTNESYVEEYTNYLENVSKLCEQMREDKLATEKDAQFFWSFKEYVQVLLQKLDEAIKNGDEDVAKYKKSLEQITADPTEVEMKNVFIEVAIDRLMALRTTSEIMKGMCGQIQLKLAGSMRQKIKYDEYLQVTAPSLNIYASLAVGVKRDSGRIQRLKDVREVTNETLQLSSKKLTDNTRAIVELDSDNLITRQTMESIVNNFREGVQLLANSQAQKENMRTQMLAAFERYDEIFRSSEEIITKALMGGNFAEEAHGKSLTLGSQWKKRK